MAEFTGHATKLEYHTGFGFNLELFWNSCEISWESYEIQIKISFNEAYFD